MPVTLEAWAAAVPGTPWDHTSVRTPDGRHWPCWGGPPGGEVVDAAPGDPDLADRLAGPGPGATAGLRYGIEGVCQQAANRILLAAGGATVAASRGYGFAAFAFGAYGLGPWPDRALAPPPDPIAAGAPRAVRGRPAPDALLAYGRALAAAHAATANPEAIRLAELAALVELALGAPLPRSEFDGLSAIQAGLRRTRADLAGSLDAGATSRADYYARLVSALGAAMDQARRLLGDDRFRALVGGTGEAVEGLVMGELFLAG